MIAVTHNPSLGFSQYIKLEQGNLNLLNNIALLLIVACNIISIIHIIFPKIKLSNFNETEANINIVSITTSIFIILSTYILFFAVNEIGKTTSQLCNNKSTFFILILYVIITFIAIWFQKYHIYIIVLLCILIHIVLWEILLLSPLYKISGSKFAIILDFINSNYFYNYIISEEEIKVVIGTNFQLHPDVKNGEIQSIKKVIPLYAYNENGKFVDIDNLGDDYIEIINSVMINDELDQEEISGLMNQITNLTSALPSINFKELSEFEKNYKIIKKNPILFAFNPYEKQYLIKYFFERELGYLIDQIYNKNKRCKVQFYKTTEKEFFSFVLELYMKYESQKPIEITDLLKTAVNLKIMLYRIPLYMKLLHGQEENDYNEQDWVHASFQYGEQIIIAYHSLLTTTMERGISKYEFTLFGK